MINLIIGLLVQNRSFKISQLSSSRSSIYYSLIPSSIYHYNRSVTATTVIENSNHQLILYINLDTLQILRSFVIYKLYHLLHRTSVYKK